MTNYIKTKLAIRMGDEETVNPALDSIVADFIRTTVDTKSRSGIVTAGNATARVLVDKDEIAVSYLVVAQVGGTATGFTITGKKNAAAVSFAYTSDEVCAISGLDTTADVTVIASGLSGATGDYAFFAKGI